MEVLADAEMRLRDAASKKILVEVALLKAIEARSAMSIDSVLKQLQGLREGQATGIEATPVPARAPAPAPKPSRAEAAMVSSVPAQTPATPAVVEMNQPEEAADSEVKRAGEVMAVDGDLETLWARLIEAVGRASPFARTYLLEAHPVSFGNNLFTIGFAPEFEDHIGLVDNARNHTLLQTKLSELGHPNTQIKFVKAEQPAGRVAVTLAPIVPQARAATASGTIAVAKSAGGIVPPQKEKLVSVPFDKDQFKNDPLIQKALEVFKGQIVEVRV